MDDVSVLNMEDDCMHLPPGFRFYPTDEELITHYLLQKITLKNFSARAIGDVDLNKCEPWDLPSKAKMGEKEWYFFCQKDRKYSNGNRTNRATEAGYWKATGKDKEIYRGRDVLVGMKKTLVFHTGRAPKGQKTSWVIHEYRLEGMPFSSIPKSVKDEWVVCRVFDKNMRIKTSPTPAGSEGVHSAGEDLFDSTTLPPLMDPPSSCFKYNKDESFDFKEVPSSISTMMAMENQQAINHQASSNPPQNQVFHPQVLPQSSYCSFAGSANLGYLHQQDAMLRAKSDASSAIRRHCKVERCSNQSIDCPSQDTGLITDRNIEMSSLMSKHYGDLDNPSSSGPVMDLDSIWKY